MTSFPKSLENKLSKRKEHGHFRELTLHDGIDFHSNDYLGLSRSIDLKEKILKEISELDLLGATGSRLISGHSELADDVENELARIFRSESCLLFSSGYALNVGLMECLGDENNIFILDQSCHSSLKDGAKLSKSKVFFFRHNDIEHLEKRLRSIKKKGDVFIVTESLFSMEGDFSPLKDLVSVSKRYNTHIVLDEAHALGVVGCQGRGLACDENLEKEIFVRIGTFGKAFGLSGAVCFGDKKLTQFLANFCHSFVYTTGMSPLNLVAIRESVRYQQSHPGLLELLQINSKQLNSALGLKVCGPIVPIVIAGKKDLENLQSSLKKKQFRVNAIYSPTVKRGEERLRVCVHSFNKKDEIERLSSEIRRFL